MFRVFESTGHLCRKAYRPWHRAMPASICLIIRRCMPATVMKKSRAIVTYGLGHSFRRRACSWRSGRGRRCAGRCRDEFE